MIQNLLHSGFTYKKISAFLVFTFFLVHTAQSQSGKVFHDFNGNGILDLGEPGVQGIKIKSYNASGSLFGSGTSDGNGNYMLSPAAGLGQSLRIEFEIPAAKSFFKPSTSASVYGSNVQFVKGPSFNINFAVLNSGKYTQGNPFLAVPLNVKGEQITGANKNEDVLLNINNAWGASTPVGSMTSTIADWRTPSAPIGLAKAQEVGTTYGVAYSKKRKTVYTSALYRQFCGFGPGGPGAIYSVPVDPVTGTRTAAPSLFANVATMATVMADIHGADLTTLAHSDTRLAPTTKNSLGDLEISDDETKLYTVNLTSREVIAINAITGTMINKWAVPTTGLMTSAGVADPNDIRPFGLGYKDGELYVGAVCTGESSVVYNGTATSAKGNREYLHAYVWKLNETTGVFTLVFDYRLRNSSYRWMCWQSSWVNGVRVINPTDDWANCPQAILTDIEFYGNDLTLSFRDRQGDLWGYEIMDPVTGRFAYGTIQGDVVGAAYDAATGTYTLESNGNIGSRIGTGAYAAAGSTEFEFYRGDGATNYTNGHVENAMGGLAQYGAYPLVFSTMAPADMFNSHLISCGGLGWINNENGNAAKAYIAYESKSGLGTMGKANGLGDVCVLGAEAPLEIGNRVWNDLNNNGIQDANEPGIDNIHLSLFADFNNDNIPDGIALANTVTNTKGEWYFNQANIADGDPVTSGNQPGLKLGAGYIVRIGVTDWNDITGLGKGSLSLYYLTLFKMASTGLSDVADNDASLTFGLSIVPQIKLIAGQIGESNHNLDFGFHSIVLPLQLMSFSGTEQDNGNLIVWQTSDEMNTKNFELEYCTDAVSFAKINTTATSGNNSTGINNYSFLHTSPATGTNYYRLKMIDVDGKFTYSSIINLKNDAVAIKVGSIYPNPFAERINISVSLQKAETINVQLINADGRVIKKQTVKGIPGKNNMLMDDLKKLAPGTYFIRVTGSHSILNSSTAVKIP